MGTVIRSDGFRLTLSGVSVTALVGGLIVLIDMRRDGKESLRAIQEIRTVLTVQAEKIHAHDISIHTHEARISRLEEHSKRTANDY